MPRSRSLQELLGANRTDVIVPGPAIQGTTPAADATFPDNSPELASRGLIPKLAIPINTPGESTSSEINTGEAPAGLGTTSNLPSLTEADPRLKPLV